MKRKRNPIRDTVTRYVGKRKKKMTLLEFFNDLENRGPVVFKAQSLFEKWTKKIRQDMMRAGTWVITDPVLFVQEYVSRLQAELWKGNKEVASSVKGMSRTYLGLWGDLEHVRLFDDLCMKIRVFGLRKKLYYFQKPLRYGFYIKACLAPYKSGKHARTHWYPIAHVPNAVFATPFGMDNIFGKASAGVNLWYKFI